MSACGCLAYFCHTPISRAPKGLSKCDRVLDVVDNRPMICRLPYGTPAGLAEAQAFRAQSGDVFISTFPKTGTTWMQQICHQLRTGGHTEFDEISEEKVVPWLEVGPAIDIDVTLPQLAAPRCFKSHQCLSALAHLETSGGKFLCMVRDPESSLKSYFKFLLAKQRPSTESRDVNAFIRSATVMPGTEGDFGASIWEFYAEYWRCRHLSNVKVVAYEHLRKDPAKEIHSINAFLGLPELEQERLSTVLELSSMKWMSANDGLFDDHHMERRLAKRLLVEGRRNGHPSKLERATTWHARVAVKKVGHDVKEDGVVTELTSETKELLVQLWKQHMEPVTGCASYSEMIAQL